MVEGGGRTGDAARREDVMDVRGVLVFKRGVLVVEATAWRGV